MKKEIKFNNLDEDTQAKLHELVDTLRPTIEKWHLFKEYYPELADEIEVKWKLKYK